MKHYKISYQLDGYITVHSKYYTSDNEQTARDAFEANCNTSLIGENVSIVDVIEIDDPDEYCCKTGSCECS